MARRISPHPWLKAFQPWDCCLNRGIPRLTIASKTWWASETRLNLSIFDKKSGCSVQSESEQNSAGLRPSGGSRYMPWVGAYPVRSQAQTAVQPPREGQESFFDGATPTSCHHDHTLHSLSPLLSQAKLLHSCSLWAKVWLVCRLRDTGVAGACATVSVPPTPTPTPCPASSRVVKPARGGFTTNRCSEARSLGASLAQGDLDTCLLGLVDNPPMIELVAWGRTWGIHQFRVRRNAKSNSGLG